MTIYEITFSARVIERVTVAADNIDDACDLAERIVQGGYTAHDQLDWEMVDYERGSADDLPERGP